MKKLITLILIAFCSLQMMAQDYTITSVRRAYPKNMKAFYSGDEVKGYYFFTFSDRSDNKKWYYKLTILDSNLGKLASKSIIVDKNTVFVSGASHDDGIMVKFYQPKEKKVTYRLIGYDGSTLGTEKRDPSKYEKRIFAAIRSDSSFDMGGVNNQGNIGFIDFINQDKSAYDVMGMDNEGEETWRYSVPAPKGIRTGDVMAASDNYTVILESSVKNRVSNDYTTKMIFLDSNGKETYAETLETDDKSLVPFSVNILDDDNQILVTGEYYGLGRKEVKSESAGLFFWVMNPDGKVLKESYANWDEDVKPLYESSKGMVKNSLYFHSIKEMSDGRIIAIAEEYKKQVSLGGIASKMLNGENSDAGLLEIKIGDLLIFTLDQEFEVKQVDVIEKNSNHINLGDEGAGFTNKHKLAKMIQAKGGFDYRFIQNDNAREKLTVVYSDSEREKGKILNQPKINTVKYEVGSPDAVQDKVSMKKAKWRIDAAKYFPSSGDQMVSMQYNRKEKKIVLETVPLNDGAE